jgi:hypothetical protein
VTAVTVSCPRLKRSRHAVVMSVTASLSISACNLTSSPSGVGTQSSSSSSPAGSSTSGTSTPSTAQHAVRELADNKNGSSVYADPEGTPVGNGLPGRIPYGTAVMVDCVAPNQTGISSVTALYHIVDGKWKGNFVVSDAMSNGGPLGNTDTPNVDPAVPACH